MRLFVMLQTMPIASQTAELLPTASERATCETEPEVLLEVTLGTMSQAYVAGSERVEIDL